MIGGGGGREVVSGEDLRIISFQDQRIFTRECLQCAGSVGSHSVGLGYHSRSFLGKIFSYKDAGKSHMSCLFYILGYILYLFLTYYDVIMMAE